MKLVKKLLRLYPFIVLIFAFIFTIEIYRQTGKPNGFSNQSLMSLFIENLQHTITNYFNFDFMGIGSSIRDLLTNNFNVSDNVIFSSYLVINSLVYELLLSLLFLFFDVFNFMLAIANKWITKGGNYD